MPYRRIIFASIVTTALVVFSNCNLIAFQATEVEKPLISLVPMDSELARIVIEKRGGFSKVLYPEDEFAYLIEFDFEQLKSVAEERKHVISTESFTLNLTLTVAEKVGAEKNDDSLKIFEISTPEKASGILVVRDEVGIREGRIERTQAISGRITTPTKSFYIEPLSDGVHLLKKLKLRQLSPLPDKSNEFNEQDLIDEINKSTKRKPSPKRKKRDTELKIAIFFTSHAAMQSDMKTTATQLIRDLNEAYKCSKIPQKAILGHFGCLNPEMDETAVSVQDMMKYFIFSPEVAKIRSCTDSDIGFLISTKATLKANAFRYKQNYTPESFSKLAFGVSRPALAKAAFQMNHELGHTFGCCDDGETHQLRYDHGFGSFFKWSNVERYTLLKVGGSGSTTSSRMNLYSAYKKPVKVSPNGTPPCYTFGNGSAVGSRYFDCAYAIRKSMPDIASLSDYLEPCDPNYKIPVYCSDYPSK